MVGKTSPQTCFRAMTLLKQMFSHCHWMHFSAVLADLSHPNSWWCTPASLQNLTQRVTHSDCSGKIMVMVATRLIGNYVGMLFILPRSQLGSSGIPNKFVEADSQAPQIRHRRMTLPGVHNAIMSVSEALASRWTFPKYETNMWPLGCSKDGWWIVSWWYNMV